MLKSACFQKPYKLLRIIEITLSLKHSTLRNRFDAKCRSSHVKIFDITSSLGMTTSFKDNAGRYKIC